MQEKEEASILRRRHYDFRILLILAHDVQSVRKNLFHHRCEQAKRLIGDQMDGLSVVYFLRLRPGQLYIGSPSLRPQRLRRVHPQRLQHWNQRRREHADREQGHRAQQRHRIYSVHAVQLAPHQPP